MEKIPDDATIASLAAASGTAPLLVDAELAAVVRKFEDHAWKIQDRAKQIIDWRISRYFAANNESAVLIALLEHLDNNSTKQGV